MPAGDKVTRLIYDKFVHCIVNMDVPSAVKTTHEYLTPEEVRRKVTDDPVHQAGYEFVYDTPVRPLSAVQVRDLMNTILKRTEELRNADSRDVIRSLFEDENIRLFAENSHPKLFEKLIDPHTPLSVMGNIRRMIDIRAKIEIGAIDEAAAAMALQHHLLKSCQT